MPGYCRIDQKKAIPPASITDAQCVTSYVYNANRYCSLYGAIYDVSPSPNAMNGQAVEDLYRVHHRWLVTLLRRKTGNVDQAADLAHDTFERVMRDDIRAILAAPRACLTNIARTLAIGHFRRAAVEAAYCEVLARQPYDQAPSPEEQALVVEAVTAVCAVLDGLSNRVHRVFMLAQVQGLSQPEIARELGITSNAVQKALSKALQHCYLAIYG